jgi:hypothetical protein
MTVFALNNLRYRMQVNVCMRVTNVSQLPNSAEPDAASLAQYCCSVTSRMPPAVEAASHHPASPGIAPRPGTAPAQQDTECCRLIGSDMFCCGFELHGS